MPNLRRIAEIISEEVLPTIYPPAASDVPTSDTGEKLPRTKAERRSLAPGSWRKHTGSQGWSTSARKEREWREANPYPLDPTSSRRKKK